MAVLSRMGLAARGALLWQALLAALLPKCPLCWAAYASLGAGIGIQLPFPGAWLKPAIALSLVSAFLVVGIRAGARRRHGLVLLAAVACAGCYASKFWWSSNTGAIASIGCLWLSAWRAERRSCAPACCRP